MGYKISTTHILYTHNSHGSSAFHRARCESESHDGKTYEGTFTVGDNSLTVTYEGKSTATEFGALNGRPLPLAQTILREMVTGQGQQQKRATYLLNMRVNSVDDYWNAVLVPNVRDCVKEPSSQTVFNAVVVTWHLFDWLWHENNFGRDTRGNDAYVEYKKELLSQCPELEWLSDLADAAKHCGLGRRTTSDGLFPNLLPFGGQESLFYVMGPYDPVEKSTRVVEIRYMLRIVTDFWLSKLKGKNLPSPFA